MTIYSYLVLFLYQKDKQISKIRHMKKVIPSVLIFILSINISSAQGKDKKVKWYTFKEAVELSKENPKKLFIDVYTDWCGWCKKMDKNTFEYPDIAEILNNNYYPVKFNAESKEPVEFRGDTFINEGTRSRNPHQLAIALLQGKMSYPSVAYMSEDLELLTAVPGYFTPEQIEPILIYFAKDHYKTKNWEEFQGSFKSSLK